MTWPIGMRTALEKLVLNLSNASVCCSKRTHKHTLNIASQRRDVVFVVVDNEQQRQRTTRRSRSNIYYCVLIACVSLRFFLRRKQWHKRDVWFFFRTMRTQKYWQTCWPFCGCFRWKVDVDTRTARLAFVDRGSAIAHIQSRILGPLYLQPREYAINSQLATWYFSRYRVKIVDNVNTHCSASPNAAAAANEYDTLSQLAQTATKPWRWMGTIVVGFIVRRFPSDALGLAHSVWSKFRGGRHPLIFAFLLFGAYAMVFGTCVGVLTILFDYPYVRVLLRRLEQIVIEFLPNQSTRPSCEYVNSISSSIGCLAFQWTMNANDVILTKHCRITSKIQSIISSQHPNIQMAYRFGENCAFN